MILAEKILSFLQNLSAPPLPPGVDVMNPYRDNTVWNLCESFYKKYYNDDRSRLLVLGINPGRYGGGTTGIPFTDPVKLNRHCDIPNVLPQRAELSADFIYQVIEACGGPEKFYSRIYISAVCPLGFTRNGKNMNYYDDKTLLAAVSGFCIQSIRQQLSFGLIRNRVYCLGEGKNFEFLQQVNQEHQLFGEIVPLPHPRFIMQYKRKELNKFLAIYLRILELS
ncbi:MAG: DUF4918 family protein [Cyclobacteriaceae bacterium]|nr:DUF4918 family protein [Cyclobacteriaceae bacterium]